MSEEAIPAATLVVIRDRTGDAPELLMVRRTARMAFAAGAMVFPGGRVDPADHALADGSDDRAGRIAAIRETLEECGIAVGLSPELDAGRAAELQARLHDGEDFAALLEREGLTLDPDALTPFTRWRPSFRHARIFDTRFYLAQAPTGDWVPRPQPGECEDALWVSAAEMLRRLEAGEAAAIFPTVRNLERLAGFANFAEAVADTRRHPPTLICPWVEERDGEPHVCIPPDLGYPVTAEPLTSAVRA